MARSAAQPPLSAAQTGGKAALLQQRRNQWQEQRCLEQDLKEAKAESSDDTKESALLEQLTQNISRRVREEMQRDMQKLKPREQVDLADKLENYLESELCHTHNCQICYQVMIPPERTPMLLFPCGHTFCNPCINRQRSASTGKKFACPLCRQPINSLAENHSLRQLIERFVQQKEALEKGRADDVDALFSCPAPRASGSGPTADRRERPESQNYHAQFQSCSMRQKILSNELSEIRGSVKSLQAKRKSNELVKQHLLQERQRICQELQLLDKHLEDQQTKIDEVSAAEADEKSKAAMIESTLVEIENRKAKLGCLSSAAASLPPNSGS